MGIIIAHIVKQLKRLLGVNEMADEQELLSPQEISKVKRQWARGQIVGESPIPDLLKAQVAKLKDMGYKSPEEVANLENQNIALYRERRGEVWYWLGDGNDHLESLTCPILIEPEDMRKRVKWNREKVAQVGYEFLGIGWDKLTEASKDIFRDEADQLKEILAGGE